MYIYIYIYIHIHIIEGALRLARAPGRARAVAAEVEKLVGAARRERAAWDEHVARDSGRGPADGGGPGLAMLLDGVRSAQNVGALLQVCEAAGVGELVLCGITPAPPDPAVLRAAGPGAAR